MLTKRVEVLFDPKEYKQLKEEAAKEKKSVATLIREAIRERYLTASLRKRKAAAKWLTSQQIDFGTWEEVKKEIIKGKIEGLPKG